MFRSMNNMNEIIIIILDIRINLNVERNETYPSGIDCNKI